MELKPIKKSERQNIADIFALTPMQEGMLFHYLKSPGSDDYFEQLSLGLSGSIDPVAVENAWNIVIKNNEMLRAVFRWDQLKEPVQMILETHTINLRDHDWSTRGPDKAGQEEAIEEIRQADRLERFDLREVPFRVTLIRVDPGHSRMLISSHHILYDGWSSGIILKEFFKAYDDLVNRRQPLEAGKTRFKEYVKWVRSRETTEGEHTWKNYLAGFETLNPLPIKTKEAADENTASPASSHEKTGNASVDRRQCRLAPGTVQPWENFVKDQKITQAALFYCAWGILLHKYCGTADVIFGTTLSGRTVPLPGIEKMVGLFIQTVPLRCQVTPTQPVIDLLFQVNRDLVTIEENAHIPLVKIKEASPINSRAELFDTLVILENYPLPAQTGTIRCDSYIMEETTHYDLTVTITVTDGIEIHFAYRTGLLDEIVMDRQPGHFIRILEQITGNPGITEPNIDLLSPAEKQQILEEFNRTETPYPREKTIPSLFREQEQRTPDRVALVGPVGPVRPSQQVQLTYREINERSGRLAQRLIEKGVRPDTIVGIMMERSVEVIIGIFGIIKAGAAYLPIDPAYPEERVKYMLSDSGARVLFSMPPAARGSFEKPPLDPTKLLFKGSIVDCRLLMSSSDTLFHHSSFIIHHSRNLAYVIYTSGTTGKPKGVMIDHYSVINRLNWMQRAYPIGAGDVILQKTPIVFDVSVWELFWWSFHGAKLCLPAPGEEKNPGAIVEIVGRQKVTTLHFVPAMLAVFLAHLEENKDIHYLRTLKQVFASGEALGTHQVKQFKRLLFYTQRTRLINLYGPTEATVDVSFFECTGTEPTPDPVPIGKPIDNIRLLILDRYLNLQPVGIPGELYIGGVGLARGYLNRPELTSEKFCLRRPGTFLEKGSWTSKNFLLNPSGPQQALIGPPRRGALDPRKNFLIDHSQITNQYLPEGRLLLRAKSQEPRAKFYQTGDLARWQPGGNIEFIGRIDHQVKIRGYRIEPGEIRECILEYPGIKEAAVIAAKTPQGETVLCAYVKGIKGREEDLRRHLAGFLPDYMVPTYIMDIQELPLTANGKINREALPEPTFTGKTVQTPPQTEIEKKLAHLWAQLLEIDETLIGSDDNFFRMGGHSLKAVLMISRVHRAFQVKLTLAEIFHQPELSRLAQVIRAKEIEKYTGIGPALVKPYYPVSSAQKRLYIIQQMNPANIDYNMNWVFMVEGELEVGRLERAFNCLLRRHEVLRTGIEMRGIWPVQVIHDIGPQPLEYITMAVGHEAVAALPGDDEISQKLLEVQKPFLEKVSGRRRHPQWLLSLVREFVRPFDLARPPLLRHRLIKIKDRQHLLMIDLHHIVTDDVSNRVLLEELLAFYVGRDLPLPRLQYKDYSEWQNQRQASGEIKNQEEYWRKQFSGGVPRLHLPLDFPRPTLPDGLSDTVSTTIEAGLAAKIKKRALETATTPYMLLLAVYCILLSRCTGETEILVGSAAAGRRHASLENIVGMFVNMLAIRNNPHRHLTFHRFLDQVKTNTLDAFDNQEYPFDHLVEALGVEARPGRNPVYDVEFNLFTRPTGIDWEEPVESEGLIFKKALHHHETLPYDLGLSVRETRDAYTLELGYQTALFKLDTIRDLARQYLEILEICLEEPGTLLEKMTAPPGPAVRETLLTREEVADFDF